MTIEADPIDVAADVNTDPVSTNDVTPDPINQDPAPAKSMDDTIRETFRKLNPEAKAEIAPEDPNKPVVEKKFTAERARDPATGKFIETPEEKAAADKAAAAAKPAETPVVGDPRHAKAPTSWKGPAQAEWDKMSPAARAEVHRREEDFHKGIQLYKGKADTFDILHAEIQPYEAMIRAANTNPQAVIRDFFNTAYQLKTGTPESKIDTLLNIADSYGVDLSLLPVVQEKRAAGQPIIAPEMSKLQQEFNQLKGTLEQQQAQQKQRLEAEERAAFETVQAELAQFAAKNPHYEAVKLVMASLIESGQAKDPQDAYDKATWAVPEVRAKLVAEQEAATRKQAAEKAAAARKASATNVVTRGTPPAAAAPTTGTMEDTIRATLRKLNGAA